MGNFSGMGPGGGSGDLIGIKTDQTEDHCYNCQKLVNQIENDHLPRLQQTVQTAGSLGWEGQDFENYKFEIQEFVKDVNEFIDSIRQAISTILAQVAADRGLEQQLTNSAGGLYGGGPSTGF